jgi:TRAP transporter TAXI family solute receptor
VPNQNKTIREDSVMHIRKLRQSAFSVAVGLPVLAMAGAAELPARAQTYGIATMQPGTLNHTTGSAIAKVLKERSNLNVLVQPTAGETTLIPMVGRGEAELGIANIAEVANVTRGGGVGGQQPDLRLIGAIHALRVAFWVRKDAPMRTIADLKGKRVPLGYSAMRTIDTLSRGILAAGGLTERDVVPVLVPNVIRDADDFVSGASDVLFFAFGAPKVREVDAMVGGIRALEIPEAGMAASRQIFPYGYLTPGAPSPFFIGLEKPMGIYSYDNMLFTNAKMKDETVYRIIDTMANNKADLMAVQPALAEFTAAGLYKPYDIAYHPGALRYFKDRSIQPQAAP